MHTRTRTHTKTTFFPHQTYESKGEARGKYIVGWRREEDSQLPCVGVSFRMAAMLRCEPRYARVCVSRGITALPT